MQKEDKVCNITPANRVGSVQEYYFSRSEERRVGKECSLPCRSRWSPYH